MKMRWLLLVLPIAIFTISGCAKKADSKKPVDQIRQEAEKMSLDELQSTAQAYAKEIGNQKAAADKIRAKLKDLSPKDLLGEQGKAIKEDVSKVTSEISELTKRYQVYASKFREMGGDASKIKIG
ncbi:MAG: hypothetical protein JW893_04275 [Candidatus Omnitrophica bacterium]|nr:hypothetical protein [Candidatus Omnitrophota bacterium]